MSQPPNSVSSFPVVLPAAPTQGSHAATKQYVDQLQAAKVSKSGDTMTGPLVLLGDPAAAMQAATKQYVDSFGIQTATTVPSTPTGDIAATNVQAALGELSNEKLARHGDSMTGVLILSEASPIQSLAAIPKDYADKMGTLEFSFLAGDFVWNSGGGVYEITINHELNRRPKVTVYTSNGLEVQADIVYNTIGVNGLVIRSKIALAIKVLLT